MILEWIASGGSVVKIVDQYPHLSAEGVKEAIQYAAEYLNNEVMVEVTTEKK